MYNIQDHFSKTNRIHKPSSDVTKLNDKSLDEIGENWQPEEEDKVSELDYPRALSPHKAPQRKTENSKKHRPTRRVKLIDHHAHDYIDEAIDYSNLSGENASA